MNFPRFFPTDKRVFWLFFALSFVARACTFFPLSIDHDEGTYLVFAGRLLKGNLPYVPYLDIKPVGIYLLFAAALKLFGHAVISVRVAGTVAVALTAFLLFLAKKRLQGNHRAALLAGLLYIGLGSLHRWSWTPNTELFFNCFTAAGLLFLSGKKSNATLFCFGLMLGLGFMIKYVVVVDYLAFCLFFLLSTRPTTDSRSIFIFYLYSLVGFFLPFAAVNLYYWVGGHYADFAFITFILPSKYSSPFDLRTVTSFSGGFYLLFAPFVPFYGLALKQLFVGRRSAPAPFLLALIWPVFAWATTLSTGKSFFHYYFHTLMPFVFFIPDAFAKTSGTRHRMPEYLLWILTFLTLLACPPLQYFSLKTDKTYVREISDFLNARLTKDEVFFTNHKAVLYFLTDKAPPTPYVHPTLLEQAEHVRAYQLDAPAEYQRIMAQRPAFCVLNNPTPPILNPYLEQHYRKAAFFGENIVVWEAKDRRRVAD